MFAAFPHAASAAAGMQFPLLLSIHGCASGAAAGRRLPCVAERSLPVGPLVILSARRAGMRAAASAPHLDSADARLPLWQNSRSISDVRMSAFSLRRRLEHSTGPAAAEKAELSSLCLHGQQPLLHTCM